MQYEPGLPQRIGTVAFLDLPSEERDYHGECQMAVRAANSGAKATRWVTRRTSARWTRTERLALHAANCNAGGNGPVLSAKTFGTALREADRSRRLLGIRSVEIDCPCLWGHLADEEA